jgi:flagellar hook-associated protein FlgK
MAMYIRGEIRRLTNILSKSESELEEMNKDNQVMVNHKIHEINLLKKKIEELKDLIKDD